MAEHQQAMLIDVGGPTLTAKEKAKAAAARRRAAKKAARPADEVARGEAHQRICALYVEEFKRARGVVDVIFDVADAVAVKKLLIKCDGSEAKAVEVIRQTFAHRLGAGCSTIRSIAREPMKWTNGDLAGPEAFLQRGHATASRNDKPRSIEDY